MKVLSVVKTKSLSHGGPPEVLKNQIININSKSQIISVLELDRITIFYFLKCVFFKSYRKKIYNFIKKFDIIHFHEIWSIKVILVVFFANKLLIKHFFVGHGYLDTWSIRQKYIKKKIFIKFFLQYAFNSASASFFSTLDELKEVRKNIKTHNTFIIPNGLSLNKYKIRKIVERKGKKKILFFGRIHKKKGLELLIKTIKKLPISYFEKFSFQITGPGLIKDVENLKKLIRENSLGDKVKYDNPIYNEEKIKYLQDHDVFILPSFEEGDSIALKEALGSYLPVIISKQCRLDIVKEYNAGLVVETNVDSLYQALINIESLDLIKMGNQARKLIEEKFDNQMCSLRLLKIYQDLYDGVATSKDWVLDER